MIKEEDLKFEITRDMLHEAALNWLEYHFEAPTEFYLDFTVGQGYRVSFSQGGAGNELLIWSDNPEYVRKLFFRRDPELIENKENAIELDRELNFFAKHREERAADG